MTAERRVARGARPVRSSRWRYVAPAVLVVVLVAGLAAAMSSGRPAAGPTSTAVGAVGPSGRPGPAVRRYAVRPGDTLSSIAQRRGISVVELQRLNRGIEPIDLQVGQRIRVPR